MRQFIDNMNIKSIVSSDIIVSKHIPMFKHLLGTSCSGTASETLFGQTGLVPSNCNFINIDSLQDHIVVTLLLPPYFIHHFDNVTFMYLQRCYQKIFPNIDILEIPQLCNKYKAAQWWSQHLKSSRLSKKALLCIQAYWVGEDGNITDNSLDLCAGSIEFFLVRNY